MLFVLKTPLLNALIPERNIREPCTLTAESDRSFHTSNLLLSGKGFRDT